MWLRTNPKFDSDGVKPQPILCKNHGANGTREQQSRVRPTDFLLMAPFLTSKNAD